MLRRFTGFLHSKVRENIIKIDTWILAELIQVTQHGLCAWIALFHIRCHRLHGDQLQRFRNIGVDFPGRKRHGTDVLNRNGNGAVTFKRKPIRQHFVEHHTSGINIRARICMTAFGLLGRNIMHRTKGFLGQRIFCRGYQAGNSKICYFDAAVPQDHDIMGFNIPMDDTAAMGMAQPLHNLGDKVQCFAPVQLSPAFHILLERDAVDQLHHNVLGVTVVRYIVNRYDIGVRQHGHSLCFVMEPATEIRILCQIIFEHFNSHLPIQPMVHSLINDSHAAGADHFQDLIAAIQHFPDISIHISHPPPLRIASESL